MVVGCSAQKAAVNQTPKFTIATDVRNDAVAGVTPEIEQALIKSYLSDQKSPKSSSDFKRVVNSLKVSGGTVFFARTKGGSNTFFVEAVTQKVLYVSGVESEIETNSPASFEISIIQDKDRTKVFSKVAVGTFNFAEATKAFITWDNGHQTTYELTNGTFIIELKNNESGLNQWEVFDCSGKSLYKREILK